MDINQEFRVVKLRQNVKYLTRELLEEELVEQFECNISLTQYCNEYHDKLESLYLSIEEIKTKSFELVEEHSVQSKLLHNKYLLIVQITSSILIAAAYLLGRFTQL
jgi:hypothetical protein